MALPPTTTDARPIDASATAARSSDPPPTGNDTHEAHPSLVDLPRVSSDALDAAVVADRAKRLNTTVEQVREELRKQHSPFMGTAEGNARERGIGVWDYVEQELSALKKRQYPTPDCLSPDEIDRIPTSGVSQERQSHVDSCEDCRKLVNACLVMQMDEDSPAEEMADLMRKCLVQLPQVTPVASIGSKGGKSNHWHVATLSALVGLLFGGLLSATATYYVTIDRERSASAKVAASVNHVAPKSENEPTQGGAVKAIATYSGGPVQQLLSVEARKPIATEDNSTGGKREAVVAPRPTQND